MSPEENSPVLPGAWLGMLGGGQLGRMFAVAAKRMGYRVLVLTPEVGGPASQIADETIMADFDDTEALKRFAQKVSVVTLEFENIPVEALTFIQACTPVYPGPAVLSIAQHRIREKTYLSDHGFPVTPFLPVYSLSDLEAGLSHLGTPAVLKTAGFGYDGKGQVKISAPNEAANAYEAIGKQEAVLEKFIPYEKEFSVVVARNPQGQIADYGVIENRHANHILDVSVIPADIPPEARRRAVEIARGVVETLDVVGVLCLEFFLMGSGEIMINEMAPRPHNSGHLTIEAAVTDQFEQQVRAICGLPLGETRMLASAAMVNLLGDLWENGEPDWASALKDPTVKLHLYGKAEARPGRKMGHLTATGTDRDSVISAVTLAREVLRHKALR